jgi:predicted porin
LAQAQTANVTLYGRVNLNMEVINALVCRDGTTTSSPTNPYGCVGATTANANTIKPNQYRVSSNSSRFGIRGTESLGGGLNAIFQMEMGSVGMDASGGALAGRDSFLGLQGGWGTFKIGNFQNAYDDLHAIFGNVPTLTTSILSTANLWAQGYLSKDAGGFDARLGNSIRYDIPVIAGFTGGVQIAAKDPGAQGTAAQSQRHAYVVSSVLVYNNGPLQAGIGYEQNNKVRQVTTASGVFVSPTDSAFSATAGWNFGVVRVAGVYEYLKYDTPTGDLKRNFYGASLTGNLGPGQFYGFYGWSDDGTGSACDVTAVGCTSTLGRVGGLAKGDNTGSQAYSLSYTYPMSKRTLLYTGYTKISNKANASYNFNINSVDNLSVGSKPGGFLLGAVHFF